MTWLADVVPYTPIQSVWGNGVRNRIVQTFTDAAERNTHTAALPDGALAFTADTGTLWLKRAGAWVPTQPVRVPGTVKTVVAPGGPNEAATLTTPAGYASGVLWWSGRVRVLLEGAAGTAWTRLDVNLFRGATLVYATQHDVRNTADARTTVALAATATTDAAVGSVFSLQVAYSKADGQVDIRSDDVSQTFAGVFWP